MTDIAIVDYGMGNLRSVSKALEHVAPERPIAVTEDPEVVRKSRARGGSGPGRNAGLPARTGDARLARKQCINAAMSKPFLGICIGLQMLFDSSEEGNVEGLGIVPGRVRRFFSAAGTASVEQGLAMGRGSRCRIWAGTRCIKPPNIPYGKVSRAMRVFISCIAIMLKTPTRSTGSGIQSLPFSVYLRGSKG